jgi:eukaryotic-like serine/threonine-protein kinase
MGLAVGTRLGPYEVLSPLGVGGMGEVWKARDTRLERTVAIKVLPQHLSASAESRRRFEREAKTISQLSHPHICALYDVGREGETEYLVMEYLEGETLMDRLAKGPLPLEQTLQYGIEIADALEKAHRQGIVHRDLKPGNVMLTKSGVKLLDFGLAKLRRSEPEPPVSRLSALATEGPPLTAQGTILGTLPYMAPEQLEGKEADARTDIFALGAVLYEMATGERAFSGTSQATLIGAILKDEPPPISKTQPSAPPALDRVVRRCLAKEPDHRWQSAADLAAELEWTAGGDPQSGAMASRPSGLKTWLPWAITALAVVAAVAALLSPRHRDAVAAPRMVLSVLPPSGSAWTDWFALSPDGRRLAVVGSNEGRTEIWIRRLDEGESRLLPGTEDAQNPFWSPDSRSLAFFAQRKLKRIDLETGAVQAVCETNLGRGGSWGRDGVILFTGPSGSVWRVAASGGFPSEAVKLDPSRGDLLYRFPHFLPDGKRFLVFVSTAKPETTGIYLGSLESKQLKLVQPSQEAGEFVTPDILLFARGDALVAERLDLARGAPAGEPETVLGRVEVAELATFLRLFSASQNGIIAFRDSGYQRPLVWFDRRGEVIGRTSAMAAPRGFSLSPDETQAAYTAGTQTASDVWILDLKRDVSTKLTLQGVTTNPLFSRDGRFLYYRSFAGNRFQIRRKQLRGGGPDETVFEGASWESAWDQTPDGETLIVSSITGNLGINALPLGTRKLVPVLSADFSQRAPILSPDGKWLAYDSDESGRREVYVRRFPVTEEKWQVSTRGGIWPYWRKDGKEIYYVGLDAVLMSVPVTTKSGLSLAAPERLFQTRLNITTVPRQYIATHDGQRFLMIYPTQDPSATPLNVLLNWQSPARRK